MASLLKTSVFKSDLVTIVDSNDGNKRIDAEIERITNFATKANLNDEKTFVLVYYSGNGGMAKEYSW